MTVDKKIEFIQNTLNQLYPEPEIPLNHKDPYTLLVSVVLSAQTTDVCVNKITRDLFARANTPEQMITLSYDELYPIIRPCGLAPRKARAILDLSRTLLDKHDGNVPQDFEALEALPGVGHKTASVVMAQAFGKPAFPVDTHIHRLAQRWKLTEGKNVKQTEKDLKAAFPQSAWNRLHLQIIYYGREYCPARNHNIESCPICRKLQEDPDESSPANPLNSSIDS
jgi:endonuclease-3